MMYSEEDEARLETYALVHLRKQQDLSDPEKLDALKKKLNNKWIQFFINVAIILVFGYMFLMGYSTFGDIFYYIIFGLFLVNMFLIFLQKRQLEELITYFEYKARSG